MTENNSPQKSANLQKRLEEQIQALDQSAIVAITDPFGKITYVNQKFCELSGFSHQELIGKTHRLINSNHHSSDFFKNMWETIQSGQVWRGEVKNQAKNKDFYWVDTTIVPFTNTQDEIYQFIAIRYEITDRKKAEEMVNLERQKLIESEKMASIGILSSGIAHELGNPLGAIRGRLEMLQDLLQSDEMDKGFAQLSVNKMIKSIDQISKIIRGLKSFARDGTGDDMQDFDIVELLDDILEISQQRCLKNGIQVKTHIPMQKLTLLGRETQLGQIIVNLINNAFDAVKDLPSPWISIQLKEDLSKVILEVKDSGPGVPHDIVSKIFDPFFTTKDVGKGTGLGLSLCRSFAEQHGGTLVFDHSDQVSCFRLEIPKNN